jgi:DNA-binding CsgD family transcriptional regulator
VVSAPDQSQVASFTEELNYKRMRQIAQRRGGPTFFICDTTGETIFCSRDLLGTQRLEQSKCLLSRRYAAPESIGETFEVLDENVILRIVPLVGEQLGHFAVFLETSSGRNSLDSASKLYDLTKREVEVLGLVLRGLSTVQIAQSLFISEGTVGDHIKSLFRKTKTNRRSELVARIFYAYEARG